MNARAFRSTVEDAAGPNGFIILTDAKGNRTMLETADALNLAGELRKLARDLDAKADGQSAGR